MRSFRRHALGFFLQSLQERLGSVGTGTNLLVGWRWRGLRFWGPRSPVLAIVDGWDARAACLTVASVTSACISKSLANPILQADLFQTTGLPEWIVSRAHPVTLLFCDP